MSRQVQDDLAKWDMNSAGDPENQADSRSQGREFCEDIQDFDAHGCAGVSDHQEL